MDLNKTKKALQDFARDVVDHAKKNLRKKRIRRNGKSYPLVSSGQLEKSVDDKLKVSPNSFQLEFMFADYGAFVDAGVDGKKTKYGKRKYGLKAFSYKTKMPPPKAFDKWVVKQGIAPRGKKGQFKKRSIQSVGFKNSITFLIARSIFQHGMKPSYFFSEAFESAYKKFPQELIDKYALDVESFLDYTIPNK